MYLESLCPNQLGFGKVRWLQGGSWRAEATAWADRALLGRWEAWTRGFEAISRVEAMVAMLCVELQVSPEPSSSLHRDSADPGTPQGIISMFPSRG